MITQFEDFLVRWGAVESRNRGDAGAVRRVEAARCDLQLPTPDAPAAGAALGTEVAGGQQRAHNSLAAVPGATPGEGEQAAVAEGGRMMGERMLAGEQKKESGQHDGTHPRMALSAR